MSKLIPLSGGYVSIVDDDDYNELSRHSWSGAVDGRQKELVYARSWTGGAMHRRIMKASKGLVVDHINHDTLDNRKANLRICTNTQNTQWQANRPGKTGYRGVHINKTRFQARIRNDGKSIHIGYFATALEAARAYDTAALDLRGEFAVLNFEDANT